MLATADFSLGELLTRWTVRLAVACYLGRVILDVRMLSGSNSLRRMRQARWLWTCGGALYALHVLCAFGFYHQWSHVEAYQHTAEQTAALTGFHWGGGLYVNYAFTLFWLTDVVAWWSRGEDFPYRWSYYFWALHGVFAFMVLNATVVFGPPVWKWAAAVFFAALLVIVLRRK